ncbi:MAG: hypothetical protein MZV65_44540 [Chromatiales bacterium]|nr:hypothetical protein [Chromatiales bacterium]
MAAMPPATSSPSSTRIRREAPPGETPLVCVILDGENAWEYYPYNGYYFLERSLHRAGGSTRRSAPRPSPSDLRGRRRAATASLSGLVAGSWVYGTLSTWIGDADKNRAWDLLCDGQAELRPGHGQRPAARPKNAAAAERPAGGVRGLRLVLVVRRLQPAACGGELRQPVSPESAATVRAARPAAAGRARRSHQPWQRRAGVGRHDAAGLLNGSSSRSPTG